MVAQLADDQIAQLTDLDAIRAELAEKSLKHFVHQAWPIIEPSTRYLHNWHIDAICDHLEATMDSRIRNLLITMPPRSLKSIIVSVMFPAWVWARHPERRFLYASYARELSSEHSQLCRMVIESDWYQARWGDRVSLEDDDNLKTRFSNTARGQRIAISVNASTTGLGGDYCIVDDPHNVQKTTSAIDREAAVRWWNKAMSTRLNNPETGVRIVVMQRVHEDDVAGSVLKQGDYVHLNLPMEYEGESFDSPIGWTDPRTEVGELLHPERLTADFVARQKIRLGSYDFASQYQQRPAPLEGGILKRHWFNTYTVRPYEVTIIQSWDTAFKDGTTNDYSVCSTIAYTPTGRYILDVYQERLEFPDLERMVPQMYAKWRPEAVLVEDKASGQSLLQKLRRDPMLPQGMHVIPITVPNVKDWKIVRVNELAPMIEAGKVHMPESASWLDATFHELLTFPLAAHDDIVDSIMQGLQWIETRLGGGTWSGSWLPDGDDDDDRRGW